MIFQKRQDFKPRILTQVLGSTQATEITREFPIERIDIVLSFTQTAAMATANADSIQNILQNVRLEVSDGARTRNVVNCSGSALLEYQMQIQGNLDRTTSADVNTNTNVAKQITYPIWFAHPQLQDPTGSSLLLPAPRFSSNPVLTTTIATQAQMDTNVTPTFAIAAGITIQIVVIRRQVSIPKFTFFDTELAELTTNFASSGTALLTELPIPGSYLGILARGYTTNNTRGNISPVGGVATISLLGTNIRRFEWPQIQIENDYSKAHTIVPVFTGSFYLDFITDKSGESVGELGSVLDANIPVASGAKFNLNQDITGGATVQQRLLMHRVFGNLNDLKLIKT